MVLYKKMLHVKEKRKRNGSVFSFCMRHEFQFCRTYHLHSVSNVTHTYTYNIFIYCAQSKCWKTVPNTGTRSLFLSLALCCLFAFSRNVVSFIHILNTFSCFFLRLYAECRLTISHQRKKRALFSFSFFHMYFTSTNIDITIARSVCALPRHSSSTTIFNCCHSVASYKCLPIFTLVLQTRTRKFHALFTGISCFSLSFSFILSRDPFTRFPSFGLWRHRLNDGGKICWMQFDGITSNFRQILGI